MVPVLALLLSSLLLPKMAEIRAQMVTKRRRIVVVADMVSRDTDSEPKITFSATVVDHYSIQTQVERGIRTQSFQISIVAFLVLLIHASMTEI